MKKVAVDFKYLTPEVLDAIAKAYPQKFSKTDIICFTNVNQEIEERVKLILNDTLFLINKSSLEDAMSDRFDEDYFASLRTGDESCDAEFCE